LNAIAPAVSVMPAIALDEMRTATPLFDLIGYADAMRRGCAILAAPSGSIQAVLTDARDGAAQDWIEELLRIPFDYRLASRGDFDALLASHESELRAMATLADGDGEAAGSRESIQDISFEAIGEADSPVVKLVNSTLHDALKAGASDIHLETTASGLVVKYRVDGVLATMASMEGSDFADKVLSRVKVLAELDIAERRIPQDGRFKAANRGREVDFRVSVMPSVFGEDAVLRVLDKRALADETHGLTLEQLGFDEADRLVLRRLAREPHGMVLVTGPTGSGKTTTLYALIGEVHTGLEKIVTIEDPVEYQLPGIL